MQYNSMYYLYLGYISFHANEYEIITNYVTIFILRSKDEVYIFFNYKLGSVHNLRKDIIATDILFIGR